MSLAFAASPERAHVPGYPHVASVGEPQVVRKFGAPGAASGGAAGPGGGAGGGALDEEKLSCTAMPSPRCSDRSGCSVNPAYLWSSNLHLGGLFKRSSKPTPEVPPPVVCV